MGQKDYIAPVKTVEQKTVLDLQDFVKYLHKMVMERGYAALIEQSHKETTDDAGNKKMSFYWVAIKKLSNYVKLYMEIVLNASVKVVTVEEGGEKKTMHDGNVSVSVGGYLLKDYEDEWKMTKERPSRKFMREIYDKLIGRDRLAANEAEFSNDIKLILGEVKTYLKMHRTD